MSLHQASPKYQAAVWLTSIGLAGFPHAAIEKCLAHEIASAVERAYARSDLLDKRREIMAAWAAYAQSAIATGANVVTLAGNIELRG